MPRREKLRLFPDGQSCAECSARRWYPDSGFRYCENGHQVEGFIEYDVDLDDNFGKTGRVSRKKKEIKEKERKHLSGNDARELFLGCLQLILRKQIFWLVKEKQLPSELETVVRDLWDLRVRNFRGLKSVNEKSSGRGKESRPGAQSGSEGELSLFSSHYETDAGTDDTDGVTVSKSGRIKTWSVDEADKWPLPTLLDTLALSYLGCLAMRLPVRLGDMHRWAKENKLLYRGAIDEIPHNMRDRLPASYQKVLQGRHTHFKGGELHRAVMDLARGYSKNYDMIFPPLNASPMLLRYLRELALPLEVFLYAKELVTLLRLDFSISTRARITLDNPETLLVATIVFITKLLYPMDGIERSPTGDDDPSCLRINWLKWQDIFEHEDQKAGVRGKRDFDKLTSIDVSELTEQEMDEYLDWYQRTKLMPREDVRDMDRLFPLRQPTSSVRAGEGVETNGNTDIEARIHQARGCLTPVEPQPLADGEGMRDFLRRPENLHQRFQAVDELSGPAKTLHEKAAEYSGLSVKQLVEAVFRLEQKVLYWQDVDKKRKETEDPMQDLQFRPVARFLGAPQLC